jgi:hypothetical protein
MANPVRILYCHCAHAQVVPRDVKEGVLRALCDSGASFEAVGDLCGMAARRDPALHRLSAGGPVKIAACYPRAVKWLFAAAGAPLDPSTTEVLNMRVDPAAVVSEGLSREGVSPNLPSGKPSPADAPPSPASIP